MDLRNQAFRESQGNLFQDRVIINHAVQRLTVQSFPNFFFTSTILLPLSLDVHLAPFPDIHNCLSA